MTNDNTVHGMSDDIITFQQPIDVAFVVEATFDGPANFIVSALSASGDMLDVLINTIGTYRGRVLCIEEDSVPMLEVRGQGPWQLAVLDLGSCRRWDGRSHVSGVGDDVLFLPDNLARFTPVTFSSRCESNVIVNSISAEDWDNLVNVIGDYAGTVGVKPGTEIIQIKTEGPWELAAR